MQFIKILPILLIITASCSNQSKESKPAAPNIILFLVDDMGWQDTSVPFWTKKTEFNQRYQTPNMERLAAEGMKFTQAYATAVCSPTRVSLMTGMNAARHRVTNWTLHPDVIKPRETDHPVFEFPVWNVNGISPDSTRPNSVHATPLPAILKNNGYHTIHVGKAHFGAIGTVGADPINLGFKVNIAGHAPGAPKSYYGTENFGNLKKWENIPQAVPGLDEYHGQDIYLTEALTNEALEALDQTSGPFFLYMSYYAVHGPIMANQKYLDKYLALGLDSIEASYATMIETMDQSVGRFLDYLDEKGLAEETVILFMSDNGGLSAVYRGGEPHTHNYPLASGKGSIREGGIREPMLARWPGVIPAGSTSDDYLIIEDFFPSILEIAGISGYQKVQEVDGQSFVPLLHEQVVNSDRPLFWHFPNKWGPTGPGVGAYSAVRQGDWKLVYFHADQSYELYNLDQDISETSNLTEEFPDIRKKLAEILADHLISVDAQMPVYRETGQVVPFPQ